MYPGYIQFSRSNSIGSVLIRLFTMSPYSHVDAVMPKDFRENPYKPLVGSLLRTGVTSHSLTYPKTCLCRIDFDTQENHDKFFQFILNELNKKYDLVAIFGMFFHKRDWHDNEKWFCSELIAAAAIHAGVTLVDYHTSRITPIDLMKSVKVIKVM